MKVTLLMALTLDGRIGKNQDHFPDWTGKADKKLFVALTKCAGALVMGSKTFDTIGKPLPGRKNIVMTRNPNRVSEWDNLVYTDKSPGAILDDLEKEGFTEVILTGGALINSLFAMGNLIDEIVVTISPLIFGYGLSLFTDKISMTLALMDVERIDTNLVCLKYAVVK